MRLRQLTAAGIALLLCVMLGSCKGRTTEDVHPDGSPEEEVVIPETTSAEGMRDLLRQRVKRVAPERPKPRAPRAAQAQAVADSAKTTNNIDPFGLTTTGD